MNAYPLSLILIFRLFPNFDSEMTYRFFASWNKFRTLAAPNPPTISMNSDPFMDKKGTLASVAIALANIVLPQPGGPKSKAPEIANINC